MAFAYAPYPRTVAGALGGVGLGSLTYPSWIPQTCVNCSSSTLDRWKTQTAFAMGWYDIFRNLEKFPSADQAERFKRFGSYAKPELAMDPNNKFWSSTPERLADHADIVKQALRHGSFHSSTSFTPGAAIASVAKAVAAPVTAVVHAVEKIPVIGDAVRITSEVATAPLRIASNIASGARLDHVALAALKDQIKTVKDAAPYAQTVVSLVPGIGTGVSAAIGAGAALAEGQSITEIGKAAIRGALPGGPLAAAGFDAALKIASGENVAQATLESSRNLIPEGPGRKAFDIGLAVVTGEKIQTALANGLVSIAPGQMQEILAAGQKALTATPSLANAIKSVAPGAAAQGFQIAAGLLSSTGMNEKALAAARNGLPANVRQGFDEALKTQIPHLAWLANVVASPSASPAAAAVKAAAPVPAQLRTMDPPKRPAAPAPAAPLKTLDPPKRAAAPAPLKTLDPPKRAAAPAPAAATKAPVAPGVFVYAPYPSPGALSGPPPECRSLGTPIADMPHGMRNAGLSAVNGSGGRSRMVHGPDGNDYLFAFENGALVARQCFS